MFLIGTLNRRAALKADPEITSEFAKNKKLKFSKRMRILSLIPLIFLVVSLLLGGVRIIDSSEIGVIKTFGVISGTIDDGIHVVNPLFDTVDNWNLKYKQKTFEFDSYSKDTQSMHVNVTYEYSISGVPEDVMNLEKNFGSQGALENMLDTRMQSKIKNVLTKYSAVQLLEGWSTISGQLSEACKPLEAEYNIRFRDITINGLEFEAEYEKAAEAKNKAEQEVLTAQAKVKQAEAEAQAMKIQKEALEAMPEAYIAQQVVDKWDGKMPETYVSGGGGDIFDTVFSLNQ